MNISVFALNKQTSLFAALSQQMKIGKLPRGKKKSLCNIIPFFLLLFIIVPLSRSLHLDWLPQKQWPKIHAHNQNKIKQQKIVNTLYNSDVQYFIIITPFSCCVKIENKTKYENKIFKMKLEGRGWERENTVILRRKDMSTLIGKPNSTVLYHCCKSLVLFSTMCNFSCIKFTFCNCYSNFK